MESNKADYTNTFCYLMNIESNDNKYNNLDFKKWLKKWEDRILINKGSKEKSINLMRKNNPIVIPRNHKVEEALEAANNDNLKLLNKLLVILKKPYNSQNSTMDYQTLSENNNYKTFCGT